MPKVGSRKNFGWGAKLKYAGKNAIHDYFGDAKYATKVAHINRWVVCCDYLASLGITDASDINNETLADFAADLKDQVERGSKKISYAVNLLSTSNVTLRAMRGDGAVKISPSAHVGLRPRVRTKAPPGIKGSAVKHAAADLLSLGMARESCVIELCRGLGARKKEACLIDARQALSQALESGQVNITRGTKGGRGRDKDRWIDVPEDIFAVLVRAAALQGSAQSLVPTDMTLKQFIKKINKAWDSVRGIHGLTTIHDLRAAYACQLYEEITGYPAPVIHGRRLAPSDIDLIARKIISYAMGHDRLDSATAYIGTRRAP